jgi:hypothetical protein
MKKARVIRNCYLVASEAVRYQFPLVPDAHDPFFTLQLYR